MELFGWQIARKKEEIASDAKEQAQMQSFTPEQKDDGAMLVAEGGIQGTYLDLNGQMRNEGLLVTQYRELALQPEIESAIDDIINQFISYESGRKLVEINLDQIEFGKPVKDKIRKEFDEVIRLLDFNNAGYDIIRRWYIDGRLPYHLIIDEAKPERGILETRYIDPRKIKKVRVMEVKRTKNATTNTMQEKQDYYVFSERGFDSVKSQEINPMLSAQVGGIKIASDSIVYITSGLMDSNNKMVLSYLHKAIKPANQLRAVEDASVIYRLSRAPERRVFYIDVGNLPKAKADQYVHDLMTKFKNRLVYDAASGEIKDDRKFTNMLEDFWLPRREGGRGTEIDTLQGGQNLGEMEDILYFQKRLLKSLGVPISRLESDSGFGMGRSTEITRDELKFDKMIDRFRMRFSGLFKSVLGKQLILKKVISAQEADTLMKSVTFDFMKDSYFTELKETELMVNRLNVMPLIDPYIGKYFSHEYVRTEILRQSESDMARIDDQKKKEQEAAIDAGIDQNNPAEGEDGAGPPQQQEHNELESTLVDYLKTHLIEG